MIRFVLLAALAVTQSAYAEFLRVEGNNLYYGNQRVFLSGANVAWNSYGRDFGNNQYNGASASVLESYIKSVKQNGGNALRIWLHVGGDTTPQFDSNGYVLGTDAYGTMISELGRFLDYAAEHDVFVILVLWNGAAMSETNTNLINLIWDDSKLNSYIEKALKPMVRALKNKPALAAWEIMNEPEGSVYAGKSDPNPCYDTSILANSGAGWTNRYIPMERLLRFIGLQSAAIHSEDSKALVTVGSWSERPQSDAFPETQNYYKDTCLQQASGSSKGKIDFYQIHTYSWQGKWSEHSPFKVNAADYNLDKPLVIGEFASVCAQGESPQQMFKYAYDRGYAGALSWQYNAGGDCSDTQEAQNAGMREIQNLSNNGLVHIDVE